MPGTILSLGGDLVEHRFNICQFYATKFLHSTFVAFLGTSLTHFVEIMQIMRSITVTSWNVCQTVFFPVFSSNPKWRRKEIRCLIVGSKCNVTSSHPLSALRVPPGNTLPTSRRGQEELEGRYSGREGKGREEGALRGLKAGEKCKTLIFAIYKALEY